MSAAETKGADKPVADVLLRQPDDTAPLHFRIHEKGQADRSIVIPGKNEGGAGSRGVRVAGADYAALKGGKAFSALVAADKILVAPAPAAAG